MLFVRARVQEVLLHGDGWLLCRVDDGQPRSPLDADGATGACMRVSCSLSVVAAHVHRYLLVLVLVLQALLYLVPCTLIPFIVLAWKRGDLDVIWNGYPEPIAHSPEPGDDVEEPLSQVEPLALWLPSWTTFIFASLVDWMHAGGCVGGDRADGHHNGGPAGTSTAVSHQATVAHALVQMFVRVYETSWPLCMYVTNCALGRGVFSRGGHVSQHTGGGKPGLWAHVRHVLPATQQTDYFLSAFFFFLYLSQCACALSP